MNIECTINGIKHNFSTNADKPLSLILNEIDEGFAISNSCQGGRCGNCLVMMDEEVVMSCLVPAFKIQNANIMTYDGFTKTIQCKEIERAYTEAKIRPCKSCYASKTFLIESILRKIEKKEQDENASLDRRMYGRSMYGRQQYRRPQEVRRSRLKIAEYLTSIDVNACRCLEIPEIERIVRIAMAIRTRNKSNAAKS